MRLDSDTSPAIQRLLDERAQSMTMGERFALTAELTDFVIAQSRAAIATTMPFASEQEVNLRWCEVHYGVEFTDRVRRFLATRAT